MGHIGLTLRWNMTSSMKDGNCKMAAALFKITIVSAGVHPQNYGRVIRIRKK